MYFPEGLENSCPESAQLAVSAKRTYYKKEYLLGFEQKEK